MGDTVDDFRALAKRKLAVRNKYGVECAECRKARPKGQPKILLPGARCGYGHRDPRPELTNEQWRDA